MYPQALLAAAFDPDTEGELTYARRLLPTLDRTMPVLADAAFDAAEFLSGLASTGAQFLVRSSARRRTLITHRLPRDLATDHQPARPRPPPRT
ncbi:hypothetical protein ACFHYQ_16530 [Sphaerimonospora cavernae]|uniref:Transposase IS4-like domain-containing protein n=1 Tax=Sphaerimonospora cavernae TaxID=1740611 RepID=A0ABV6U659_9ACTN